MQLVCYGAPDVYLTGNPQISFFHFVYQRHTHFAVECIDVPMPDASFGKECKVTLPRKGDMVSRTYLVVTMPEVRGKNVRWVDDVHHAMIENVSLEIGGQIIESQTGEFMHIWKELSLPPAKLPAYTAMTRMPIEPAEHIESDTLYIPLELHFCKLPSLAIPMIALQFKDVNIKVTFRKAEYLLHGTVEHVSDLTACLAADYIFLDTDERRRLAQNTRETLMTQVQNVTCPYSDKIALNFTHMCKELIFVCQPAENVQQKRYFDYSLNGKTPVRTVGLKMNGHERFERRSGKYFNVVQPFQHHTNLPSAGVHVYSFALNPESHHPSETCNMSRIDNLFLMLDMFKEGDYRVSVYAINYNIMRFMKGEAGLAYSS